MRSIEVVVERVKPCWRFSIPELDEPEQGYFTGADVVTLAEVDAQALATASLQLDVEPEHLELRFTFVGLDEVQAEWRALEEAEAEARQALGEVAERRRRLVRDLRWEYFLIADVARLLGISTARVSQLTKRPVAVESEPDDLWPTDEEVQGLLLERQSEYEAEREAAGPRTKT